MSRFYNANSVPPRDTLDSDSDMNYITADSRRNSETSGFDASSTTSRRTAPEYIAPRYANDRNAGVSFSPSSDGRSSASYLDDDQRSNRPMLVMDQENVLTPVRSRESLALSGLSRTDQLLNLHEINSSSSPRLRAALHQLSTKPIDKIHHYSQLGEYVKELYLDKGMADVLIKIDDETFPTHRIALASQSAYFSNLFLNEVSNTRLKLPLEIRIKGIEPDAFKAFLNYIYTGELNVRPDLVSDFLFMSSKLRCQGILETWQELLDNMSPEQALILVDKVSEGGPLHNQALKVLRNNFTQLHQWKRYYRLSVATMCKLLMDDELVVKSEADVFEEAQRWLNNAIDLPRDSDVRILRRIRYSLMSARELFHCCQTSHVFKTDPVCKEMVLRANWLHTQQELGVQDGIKISGSKPRKKVTDGDLPKPGVSNPSPATKASVSNYQPVRNSSPETSGHETSPKWRGTSPAGHEAGINDFPVIPKVDRMDTMCEAVVSDYSIDDSIIGDHLSPRRAHRAKVTVGPHSSRHCGDRDGFLTGDILAVGGTHRKSRDHRNGRHVQRYSSEKNRWMQFAPLPEHRQNHAVAIFGGKLYLTGGCETDRGRRASTQACNRVFVFDTDESVWNEVAPMLSRRRCHSLCPLFGKLYALGGQDERGRVLNTAERYNPHENCWNYITPMKYARLGAGGAVFNGFLYVVGGYGDEGSIRRGLPILKVVECFDPRIHKWNVKHDLRVPRCYCNLVCSNNRLFVFGGAAEVNNMLQSIGSVDLYDPKSDTWENVANLQTPRHNSGSAVIGNKVYIIGGVCSKDHNQVLQSIECYNAGTGFWESGVEPLPHPAKSVGCAVLPVIAK